jgi:integrase
MPRHASWPPKVYWHRPSGLDRVRVNGRDYYLGPHDSPESRTEYARLLAELVERGEAGPPESRRISSAGKPGFTVADVIRRFLEHARETYSQRGGEYDQFRYALAPLERLFGDLPAAAFDVGCLLQLQEALATGSWLTAADRTHHSRAGGGGLARGTVNRRVVKIRTVWRWAELHRLVPPGSWQALRSVPPLRRGTRQARETTPPRPATLAEVKAVGRCAPAVVRAMLLVQWWSACRSGEVRAVRAGEVDTSADVWLYRPRQHKTDYRGDVRVIALGRKAQAVLRPWLTRALEGGPETVVFPNPRGKTEAGWSLSTYSHAVQRAAARAGLPGWHSYRCRHGARLRISRAAGMEAARAVLGHRHVATTEGYAAGVDHQHAADVQRRLG